MFGVERGLEGSGALPTPSQLRTLHVPSTLTFVYSKTHPEQLTRLTASPQSNPNLSPQSQPKPFTSKQSKPFTLKATQTFHLKATQTLHLKATQTFHLKAIQTFLLLTNNPPFTIIILT